MKINSQLARGLGFSGFDFQGVRDVNVGADERARIANSLGRLDLSYWGILKEELLTDDSIEVRRAFAQSLGQTGDEDAAALLGRLAADHSWQVRESVAIAAKNLGTISLLPVILKLISDDDSRVSAAAHRAFLKLGAIYPKITRDLIQLAGTGEDGLRRAMHVAKTNSHISAFVNEPEIPFQRLGEQFRGGMKPGFAPANPGAVVWLREKHNVAYPLAEAAAETRRDAGGLLKDVHGPEGEEAHPLAGEEPGVDARKQASKRRVNSWFSGHEDAAAPLVTDQEYMLGIQVSPIRRVGSRTQGEDEFHEPDAGDKELLDVVVAIASEDFEVLDKPAKRIKLPRDPAKPSEVATFRVRPIKNNQGVFISVFFYYQNNLFHEALVGAATISQGEAGLPDATAYATTDDRYRGALDEQRCDLNIQVVVPENKKSYRLVLFYDLGGEDFDLLSCNLFVNKERIDNLLQGIHTDIMALVEAAEGSEFQVFSERGESLNEARKEGRIPRLEVPNDATYQKALQILAQTGRRLYLDLFEPAADWSDREQEKLKRMSQALKSLSTGRQFKIQVLSTEFFIPWNLLYDGKFPSKEIIPLEFWGFKHIIEEVPYQVQEAPCETEIKVQEPMPIGLNININPDSIPRELSDPQLKAVQSWQTKITPHARYTEDDVLDAFCGKDGPYALEYFFCHAGVETGAGQDFDKSYLGLTRPDGGLTLEKIRIGLAAVDQLFRNRPLFILNACESGKMDGRFYDGFVPVFIENGACSVVGSDNKVPAIFGAHFGLELMKTFLQGESIGSALRKVRCQMLKDYHNPLGLIYRVFGDADVHLSRPLL